MLRSLKDIMGYGVWEVDGHLGHVADFLFDDFTWVIRHVVVDTGNWLPDRKVLVIPSVFERPDASSRRVHTKLTKEQIRSSPDIDTDKPVSRQELLSLYKHYSWDDQWLMMPEAPSFPMTPALDADAAPEAPMDRHLRSVKEVIGYEIQAGDGTIGHVGDMIGDVSTWTVRYLVVSTGSWLTGKKVLMTPGHVQRIKWQEQAICSEMTRKEIEACPPYDPTMPVNREYEARLYDYYGRPKYWEDDSPAIM